MRIIPETLLIYGIEIDPRALIGLIAVLGLMGFVETMPLYLKFKDKVEGINDYEKYAPTWAKMKWLALPFVIVFVMDTFVDIKAHNQKPVVLLGEAPLEVVAEEEVVEEAPAAADATQEIAAKEAAEHPGKALFAAKACASCHSVEAGVKIVGPSLHKLFGRKEAVVTAGKERNITVDEAYVTTSIWEPAKDLVKGYGNMMPSQKGLLTDAEFKTLISYLKTL